MQCSKSTKPVKAIWHDVTCTVKAKLDVVSVTNVSKHFGIQKSSRI